MPEQEFTQKQKQELIGRRAGALVARVRNWVQRTMDRKFTVRQLISSCRSEFAAFESYAQDVIESIDIDAYRRLHSDADGDWTSRSRAQLERIEKDEKGYPGEVAGGAGGFDGVDF